MRESFSNNCKEEKQIMKILGITWGKSVLVSFDPFNGVIIEKHAWLNQDESFVGLAYDYNRNLLYTISQVDLNLYSINPITRDVKLIGKMDINGQDVSGLSYDPTKDCLYTLILNTRTGLQTELAKVNTDNANVTVVGKIADGLCNSLCWRECDGKLNSYIVYGSGSWDCPYKASIVTIEPTTGAMTKIFETDHHTIMGLAKKPGQNAYFSWINSTTHFYGEVNLDAINVTEYAISDDVNVISGAMIYRDFYVSPAPNLPPCSFTDENCLGR
jgi:hypothetical protein